MNEIRDMLGGDRRLPARIDPMLALLRAAWEQNPDLRLGQLLMEAARHPESSRYRDPFNVEDDELWRGLERIAKE